MPTIPTYKRQMSIPGEVGEVAPNPANAGLESRALAGTFKEVGNLGIVLADRAKILKKQEDDNYLITEGSKLNDSYISMRSKLEQDPQYQSGNYEGMRTAQSEFTNKQMAMYQDTLKDRPNLFNDINKHIDALDKSNLSHFSAISSSRIKANSEIVRNNDLLSSTKMAQAGDLYLGINNFQKTLDAQLANGSLSKEEHKFETQKGMSLITEAYLMTLANTDPIGSKKMFDALKGALTTDTQEKLNNIINPAAEIQTGRTIGRDIFKKDKSGSLETMENKVKDMNLDPKQEDAAINEIKSSWNTRKIDEVKQIKDTNSSMITELSKKAVNGVNHERDLTPAQWAVWIQTDAPTAAAFQDKIRKENNEIARMNEHQKNEAKKELEMQQTNNALEMSLRPDFLDIDLQKEYGLKNISEKGFNLLSKMQGQKDPLKNEAVKRAMSLVKDSSAIANALKITGANKNEIAAWKQKYGDLVVAFAHNNFDKPDFETKLQEFMDKQVMSDMVTSYFARDETDRQAKFKAAQEIAGELPKKAKGRVKVQGQTEGQPQTPKKVTIKVFKDNKGNAYVLFPNGTKRPAKIDKDGRVSY